MADAGGGAADTGTKSRAGVTTEKDDVRAGPGESRSAAPGEGAGGEEAPRINTGLFNLPDTIRTLSAMGVSKSKVNPAQGILLGWQATAYLRSAPSWRGPSCSPSPTTCPGASASSSGS